MAMEIWMKGLTTPAADLVLFLRKADPGKLLARQDRAPFDPGGRVNQALFFHKREECAGRDLAAAFRQLTTGAGDLMVLKQKDANLVCSKSEPIYCFLYREFAETVLPDGRNSSCLHVSRNYVESGWKSLLSMAEGAKVRAYTVGNAVA